jgi:hypothetical protein
MPSSGLVLDEWVAVVVRAAEGIPPWWLVDGGGEQGAGDNQQQEQSG